MHGRMPLAMVVKVREIQESATGQTKFHWLVRYCGSTLAEGIAGTKKQATDLAWKRLRELTEKHEDKSKERNRASAALAYLLKSRTYLVAAVTQLLLQGYTSKKEIIANAEDFELKWRMAEPPEFRKPLPSTHRNSLTTEEAVKRILWTFEVLKISDSQPKLLRWARGTLGENFGPNGPEPEVEEQ